MVHPRLMAHLAILLHMHQPDYRHPETGVPIMPWARLHGLRGYRDVAVELTEADIDLTVNLVPSLLDQLLAYAGGRSDRHLELTERPASDLRPAEIEEIRRTFVTGHPTMIEAHSAYRTLASRVSSGDRMSVTSVRDLQVWGTLSWFGATAVRDFPVLGDLRRKGAGFTEADKRAMLDVQRAVLDQLPGQYRRLAEAGRLSTSPYYHPILPLLVDATHARRAMPHLPDEVRFRWPEDASAQLRLARERMHEVFGVRPVGLWPSEGSVSPEVVELAAAAGFRWLATDEEVLFRSDRAGSVRPGPWDLGSGMVGFFRDHGLSDRIGFQYARWEPADAVADLVGTAAARAGDGVLTLALDGENPWEAWADAGHEFRQRLYDALRTGPVRAITLDAASERAPVGRVRHLHTGSWIGADFNIWIGHPDDRAAWRLLAAAREAIEAAPPSPQRSLAEERIYPAEGSDWMWWYGDEFSTPFAHLFDFLFREHLRGVYRALGLTPPRELDRAIGAPTRPARVDLPTQPLRPRLEPEPRWVHWTGAGLLGWPAQGAMARSGRDVPQVRFGWSVGAAQQVEWLWLRVVLSEGRGGEEPGARWRLDVGALQLELPCGQAGTHARGPGIEGVVGPDDLVVRVQSGRLPPVQVPFVLAVIADDGELVRYPEQGTVTIPRPQRAPSLEWWSA